MSTAQRRGSTFNYAGPEAWMEDGACVGHNPEWWFADSYRTDDRDTQHAAIAICRRCPVQTKCLTYAMETEPGWERHGVWGGLTADARRKLGKEDVA